MSGPTLTIYDICERDGVSRENVLTWIDSGELAAVNVGPAKSKRKMWRVSQEAISEFERKRSNGRPNDGGNSVPKPPPKRYF